MSATVIPLPGAACEPVLQTYRRGRYPRPAPLKFVKARRQRDTQALKIDELHRCVVVAMETCRQHEACFQSRLRVLNELLDELKAISPLEWERALRLSCQGVSLGGRS